ncbi:hypothetical protein V495_00423 [Pseudogymnoascus sp. VKM F-4514 (FW-929)]|nr:hypothetical protein V495_00423 [Pseudogymnoascus sp. VKM F-4514 (FW-929)]KFY62855.1 hypothetical protein V497_02186 [Pseudogymnoascus sp. VKM F-4516 (FW-969)]
MAQPNAFARDYEPILRLEEENVRLHTAITQRQDAVRIEHNRAVEAAEELALAQRKLRGSKQDTEALKTAMKQSEKLLQMVDGPSGLRRQLEQQSIIGELFGEELGGIRAETVNRLRKEIADTRKSMQDQKIQAAEELRLMENRATAAKASINAKMVEWEERMMNLRSVVWGEEKRELESSLDSEKGRADAAETALHDRSTTWDADKAKLRDANNDAKSRATSAERDLREKTSAWEETEESLCKELQSASTRLAAQYATISGHLASIDGGIKQLEEMTSERDSVTASLAAVTAELETSVSGAKFSATMCHKLRERIAILEHDL